MTEHSNFVGFVQKDNFIKICQSNASPIVPKQDAVYFLIEVCGVLRNAEV